MPQGRFSGPVNAVPPLEPDLPFTVGPRVGELPLFPPTDVVDETEELPLLDDDVGGGVVEVELDGGGDVEVALGQLVRSAVASSEK
jgi:hypothetical protein